MGLALKLLPAEQKENANIADELIAGETTVKQTRKVQRKRQREHDEALKQVEGVETPWTVTESQEVISCHALITDPPYGILDEPWEPDELEAFTRDWAELWNECGADIVFTFWSQRHLFDGRVWF